MAEGIATKPQTRRRRIIERPRLTRLLDESQGRIKMLVAPAGYGKTTLARQWLEGKQAVWYTATPASVDVAALAAGLGQSVGRVLPGAGVALIERLSVTPAADDEATLLGDMLSRDLAGWPRDAWLVIDDYQEIAGAASSDAFVESLLISAPLNALLLTRERPKWVSSRRLLYGEIFEIERSALAMTDDEAVALLGDSISSAPELVSLARGWPAVLALAAVIQAPPPNVLGAPHLYGFFADEIYRRLDRRVRRTLCELALYDVAGRHVVLRQMRADYAERVVGAGLACGFFTEGAENRLELHPLARAFLQIKLREERAKALTETVGRAVRTLLDHALWDEAFDVIRDFGRDDLIPDLLTASMDDLLTAGRSATLKTWIGASKVTAPVVRLVTAELAFREGRFYESEALAALAADDLASEPGLAARASFVAGRAAHVASRETKAQAYYKQARVLSKGGSLERKAAFGELVATIELEDEYAAELLDALANERSADPSDQVLLADRILAYETRFQVPVDLQRGRDASQLLHFVTDPVARASFRNIFGYALASTGHFSEATVLMDEQLREAERCRLDFVIPYALAIQALVASGQRFYEAAESLLDEANERALKTGDLAAVQAGAAIHMRVLISQASYEAALLRSDVDLSTATRSLRGELLAVQALALAGAGHVLRSTEIAEAALSTSIGVETAICSHSALALGALNQGDQNSALIHARSALDCAVSTGMIESFVSAYRGSPDLLVCLLQDRERHETLSLVLTRAGDGQLLVGSGASNAEHSVMSLSPREKEVLALLAQGLTNAAIGQALFISPVTVKVHVRHIYDKLGVRSRAAAALRATQLNRP